MLIGTHALLPVSVCLGADHLRLLSGRERWFGAAGLAVARERLGDARIHLGARMAGFEQDEAGVALRLDDGRAVRGDVLVAADGIHSAARAIFYPNEGMPIWNGAILWRATSIADPFLTGATMAVAGNRNDKFVVYPIADLPDGRNLTNWIAEIRVPADQTWKRED